MKIVISKKYCAGNIYLSHEAYDFLGIKWDGYGSKSIDELFKSRIDQNLVKCIEKLGINASGEYTELKVVEIPDEIDWEIIEKEGIEWIEEKHRIWDKPDNREFEED